MSEGKSTGDGSSAEQQMKKGPECHPKLFKGVNEYSSPFIKDEDQIDLKIKSILITFDDQGCCCYDRRLDRYPCFVKLLPLEHLLQHPINMDPATRREIQKYPNFDPKEMETRAKDVAAEINRYLLWEFDRAPRKGTEDDSDSLMSSLNGRHAGESQ